MMAIAPFSRWDLPGLGRLRGFLCALFPGMAHPFGSDILDEDRRGAWNRGRQTPTGETAAMESSQWAEKAADVSKGRLGAYDVAAAVSAGSRWVESGNSQQVWQTLLNTWKPVSSTWDAR